MTTQNIKAPFWANTWGEDRYGVCGRGAWVGLHLDDIEYRFRLIGPGEFLMGSPEDEPERDDDEQQHLVRITQAFWLAETACTQALWEAVMGSNPSRFKDPERPVENVSWDDAQEFIGKLNSFAEGLEFRLPTEAEWEYSCRAGTETPFWFGESMHSGQVNFNGSYPYNNTPESEYRRKTVPVKSLPPNGWGLYEMHGNVWEWCADYWGSYEDMYRDYIETLSLSKKNSIERYGAVHSIAIEDPINTIEAPYRVLRGGSWLHDARHCRSACRHFVGPVLRYDDGGFRLASGRNQQGGASGASESKEGKRKRGGRV